MIPTSRRDHCFLGRTWRILKGHSRAQLTARKGLHSTAPMWSEAWGPSHLQCLTCQENDFSIGAELHPDGGRRFSFLICPMAWRRHGGSCGSRVDAHLSSESSLQLRVQVGCDWRNMPWKPQSIETRYLAHTAAPSCHGHHVRPSSLAPVRWLGAQLFPGRQGSEKSPMSHLD